MRRRHPPLPFGSLPGVWLFSDERLSVPVERLAAHLPPGSGIVLRHDSLATGARWRLARRLMRIARARKLVILLAAPPATARRWGMDGVHLRQPRKDHPASVGKNLMRGARQARRLGLRLSMPVHDGGEARRARCADAAFVSPLHATRSHPGAPGLGRRVWLRLARLAGRARSVALGGMTAQRARALRRAAAGSRIAPGWAAIDAWERKAKDAAARRDKHRQKRNAVPT